MSVNQELDNVLREVVKEEDKLAWQKLRATLRGGDYIGLQCLIFWIANLAMVATPNGMVPAEMLLLMKSTGLAVGVFKLWHYINNMEMSDDVKDRYLTKGAEFFNIIPMKGGVKASDALKILIGLLILSPVAAGSVLVCAIDPIQGVTPCTPAMKGVETTISVFTISGMEVTGIPYWGLKQRDQADANVSGTICTSATTEQPDAQCTKDCTTPPEKTFCSGNELYCASHTCVSFGACNCVSRMIGNYTFCQTRNGDVECSGPVYKRVLFALPETKAGNMKRHFKGEIKDCRQYGTIFVNFQDGVLTIDQDTNKDYILTLRKGDWVEVHNVSKKHAVFVIPERAFVVSGPMSVTLDVDNDCQIVREIWLVGRHICHIPDCFFCWDMYYGFRCLDWKHQTAICVLLVIPILIICLMLPVVLGAVFLLIRILWTCGVFACRCCNRWAPKEKVHKYYTMMREDWQGADAQVDQRSRADSGGESGTRIRMTNIQQPGGFRNLYMQQIVMISFLVCIIGASACDRTVTALIPASSCNVDNTGTKTCSTILSGNLALDYPGFKSCIEFSDDSGPAIRLEVTYSKCTALVSNTAQYYTSSWEMQSETSAYCFLTDKCTYDVQCTSDHINSYGKTSAISWSSALSNWPGMTDCDRLSGCAWNGCFSCEDKCYWSVFSLIPKSTIYKVLSPSSMRKTPIVVVNVTSLINGQLLDSTTIASTDAWVNTSVINTKVLGTLVGDTTLFGSNKLTFSTVDSTAYYGPAADKNSPFKGAVGDIQAVSASALGTASKSAFIWDHSMVTQNVATQSVGYQAVAPGIGTLNTLTKLPAVIGGNSWTRNGDSLTSDLSNPGPVLLSLESSKVYSYQRIVNIICPEFEVLNVSGCFSCTIGSVLTIQARSTCLSGTAVVQVNDPQVVFSDSSVILEQELKTVSLKFQTPKAANAFNFCLKAGDKVACKSVSYLATEDIVLRNDTNIRQDNTSNVAGTWSFGDPSTFFDRLFHGAASISEQLILYVLIAALIALGIFLLIKFLPGCLNSSKKAIITLKGASSKSKET